MPMSSKERILAALNREKPDRLPVSVHQWQDYHLKTYLGGISALEAFKRFGMDAQIQHLEEHGQFFLMGKDYSLYSTPEWRDEATMLRTDPADRACRHVVTTPEGELTYQTEGNEKTVWVTEHLIKSDRDLELVVKYLPWPKHDNAPVAKLYDEVGDAGILRGAVWGDQAGAWQHACCLVDINDLIMKCFDDPAWVHTLLKALNERKLAYIESMKGAKYDIVETGGGASSSTVISPDIHEEFCLPYDRAQHDALHAVGLKATYHTCGGTLGIEEHIVANHCDASETLAPISIGGNQEPWDYAEKIAGRVALIGGVDQFNVVTDGPAPLIRQTVHRLFETVGKNGGYVCCLSDHFFDAPAEHLQAYADAAKECVY